MDIEWHRQNIPPICLDELWQILGRWIKKRGQLSAKSPRLLKITSSLLSAWTISIPISSCENRVNHRDTVVNPYTLTNRLEIGDLLSIAINPEKWDTRLVIVWYFVQWFLIKREKKKNFLWPASLFLTLKSLNCYLLKENENFSKQITNARWWQNR